MEFCGSIKADLRCTALTLSLGERVFNHADIISQAQWHSDSSAVCGSFYKAPKSKHSVMHGKRSVTPTILSSSSTIRQFGLGIPLF